MNEKYSFSEDEKQIFLKLFPEIKKRINEQRIKKTENTSEIKSDYNEIYHGLFNDLIETTFNSIIDPLKNQNLENELFKIFSSNFEKSSKLTTNHFNNYFNSLISEYKNFFSENINSLITWNNIIYTLINYISIKLWKYQLIVDT